MEILYLLLPLSVVLVAVVAVALVWAVRSGQFEDLEGPAHRILMDDDDPGEAPRAKESHPPDARVADPSVDRDQAGR
ncbi:MAG: cbb3-type cytochrome oxidase assembly protein CcoS [Ectothiorhodospiraceae bacterium]|nr:cbb3-type cytochrome oxidase assembly protein CcoS [Chromatiales bacterium]MCP5153789.1 cbb3-type cytochrome oxidase assembly protein CcoS [Ectothiorhodospiraceae bacterium]